MHGRLLMNRMRPVSYGQPVHLEAARAGKLDSIFGILRLFNKIEATGYKEEGSSWEDADEWAVA